MEISVDSINAIDWINHDGVNRAMINDFMRNQFYDSIIASEVNGKSCVDIGFGTGLLSMLALKHGAQSIKAYESDPERYKLGKIIIERLGLTQITLLNERFDHSMLESIDQVIFSETVSGNLWGEGLFNSLPRTAGYKFLPGQYFLEIYACVIPDSFAQGLITPNLHNGFSPGVDIDNNFLNLINQLGFSGNTVTYSKPTSLMTVFDHHSDTEWGWIPYSRLCVNNGKLVAKYVIDANTNLLSLLNGTTTPIDFSSKCISLNISTDEWNQSSVILMPRVGMQHNQFKLFLDTGHWGPTQSPVILVRPSGLLTLNHDLYSGSISYNLN
jgi:hypothetical protein